MRNPFSRTADAATSTTDDATHATGQAPDASRATARAARTPRRVWTTVALGVTALGVLGVGGAVANDAHKTITLDVDGTVSTVSTWRGSVAGLLAENGLTVTEHDVVAPAPGTDLTEGAAVTVRFAKQVTVSDGDQETTAWATGLDAGEVLDTLAGRGDDVHLVASRSQDRTELPVALPRDESLNVVVDGKVLPVPAGSVTVDDALAAAGVTLGELDTVVVDEREDDGTELEPGVVGTVAVVVTRHAVEEQTTTTAITHKTKTVTDPDRFSDLPATVRTEGKDGERTRVYRVTLVDGEAVDKEKISDEVTAKPVTEVKVRGTKERPAPAASEESSGSSSSASTAKKKSTTNQGSAPTSGVWSKLAACESGGRPGAVSANGLYHGLYQFSVSTWRSVGGSGLPSQASAAEQTKRAKMLQARSGWGQWPACSAKLGLR